MKEQFNGPQHEMRRMIKEGFEGMSPELREKMLRAFDEGVAQARQLRLPGL